MWVNTIGAQTHTTVRVQTKQTWKPTTIEEQEEQQQDLYLSHSWDTQLEQQRSREKLYRAGWLSIILESLTKI